MLRFHLVRALNVLLTFLIVGCFSWGSSMFFEGLVGVSLSPVAVIPFSLFLGACGGFVLRHTDRWLRNNFVITYKKLPS